MTTADKLPENLKQEIRDEIEYRVNRAMNEPMDDKDWFLDCAMNKICEIIQKHVHY